MKKNKAQLLLGQPQNLPYSTNRLGDHIFQEDLERHSMAAYAACIKEGAITRPFPMVVSDNMRIVLAIQRDRKAVKVHPFAFLRIPSGFLSLTDHPIIHDTVSFHAKSRKKGTQIYCVPTIRA